MTELKAHLRWVFSFIPCMTENTITIEKSKYHALLKRVFNIRNSENGRPLQEIIGIKIKDIGRGLEIEKDANVEDAFSDLALLQDLYIYETTQP